MGTALAILGAAFVLRRLWLSREALAATPHGPAVVAVVLAAALVQGSAGAALALGWSRLVRLHGGPSLPFRQAFAIYGRSQLAKYVPGNVLHFVGRHLLARRAGVPDRALVVSAAHEVLALLACAALLGAPAAAASLGSRESLAAFAGMALAVGLLAASHLRDAGSARSSPVLLAQGMFLPLGWFAACGVGVIAIVTVVADWPGAPGAAVVVGAFTTAWIAGFVVPGAPAGLGVRDAVMLGLLGSVLDPAPALAITVLVRLVSLLADVVFYGAAVVLGRDAPGPPAEA